MLPVAHHACTLATGALRSSCTMIVSPFGKIHFCAELGGNVMTGELSTEAAFKLAELNMIAMTSAKNDEGRSTDAEGITKGEWRDEISDRCLIILSIPASFVLRHSSFVLLHFWIMGWLSGADFAAIGLSGAKGFTKASLKS